MDPEKEKEVAEEYLSSLTDLNVNSKPLISMLTMLAEENIAYASAIVNAIEQHLEKVPTDIKLTILYLIDSIVKNVGNQYKQLFSHNIVNMFCRVFEKANERIREKLFNLRQTWKEVFPNTKLYALDVKVNAMDNNWPITAVVAQTNPPSTIHVNPNFFKTTGNVLGNDEIQKQLKDKERELLELQKKKLELELLATKKKLEEQEKEMADKLRSSTEKAVQKVIPPLIPPNTIGMPLAGPIQSMPKPRIAPLCNPALLARPRDPRLARQQMQMQQAQLQMPQKPDITSQMPLRQRPMLQPHPMYPNQHPMPNGNSRPHGIYVNPHPPSKLLPKIPKFSKQNQQSNEPVSNDPRKERERERSREQRKERESKSKVRDEKSKSSSSSREKSSLKSSRSDEKERKKSGDESKSPKKKRSDEKKSSSKSPSSKSTPTKSNSKSPDSKTKSNDSEEISDMMRAQLLEASKDVDLRIMPKLLTAMPRSSPTEGAKKLTKQENDELLMKLLEEDLKESGSTTTNASQSMSEKKSSPDRAVSPKSSKPSDELNELPKSESSIKDIDLRKLLAAPRKSPTNELFAGKKKRSSSKDVFEAEPSPKKNKSDLLDTLFGSKDVDLRKRIGPSSSPSHTDVEMKQNAENKKPDKPKKSLQEVRAKLAEATKKKKDDSAKLSPIEISPTKDDRIERKRKVSDSLSKKISSLDTDYRDTFKFDLDLEMENELSYKDAFNDSVKTIFQQAKDQLESGQIDTEQYRDTVSQLVKMKEKQKIRDVRKLELKNSSENLHKKKGDDVENGGTDSISQKKKKLIEDESSGDRESQSAPKRRESKWGPKSDQPQMPQIPPPQIPQILAPILAQQALITPWDQNTFIAQQLLLQQNQITGCMQQAIVQPGLPNDIPLNNSVRTVRLDGIHDYLLRYYGETAIIFNENFKAIEIRFNPGYSVVVIDDKYKIRLKYNDAYQPITIDGKLYQIKFGAPTREIYIDNCFYECYFNNRPTQIFLDGHIRTIKIEGRPPEVEFCQKRPELVLGRVNIVIDADSVFPVFLDATVQIFEIEGNRHTLQFADFFKTVVIDDKDIYAIEFGGMPKYFNIGGRRHFVRFTALQDDNIEPGHVNLPGMRRTHMFRDLKSPPLAFIPEVSQISPLPNGPAQPIILPAPFNNVAANSTAVLDPTVGPHSQPHIPPEALIPQLNLNVDELFEKLVATGIIGNKLSSGTKDTSGSGNPAAAEAARKAKEMEKKKIVPINLSRTETIKTRQQAIVELLYSGMQCSSCGLRFPPEQTMKYSQHLDWHFRQNRRDRDSQRRAHSRKWYYDCADWIRYEEIEDLDEREKNFFETQQIEAMDQVGDDSNQMRIPGVSGESSAIPSCPAGPDDLNRRCDMCHDQFEQFFNEETEEWHLRLAMKVDDKFYHPICYEDFKASLTLDESGLSTTNKSENEAEEDTDMKDVKVKSEKQEESEVKSPKPESESPPEQTEEEEDDDVIVLPNETPVVTEILDDDETTSTPTASTEKSQESEKPEEPTAETQEQNVTDDDVMIEEPNIETQNLVDDDDEEMGTNTEQTSVQTEPLIIKIKEEPKDDGYEENDEDIFMDVSTIANEIIPDDSFSSSPKPVNNSATETELHEINDNAVMISPSTIDDNSNSQMSRPEEPPQPLELQYQRQQSELFEVDDNNSHPDAHLHSTTGISGGQNRIKIKLSSMMANTLNSNRNLSSLSNNPVNSTIISNNEDNLETVQNINAVNSCEQKNQDASSAMQQQQQHPADNYEEPDIEFEVKPSLRGVKFERNLVPIKRGLENSGLCSIM